MGARNRSSVRSELRDGRRVLVIDFRYKDKDGRERRYRRDVTVQTAAGARAEAERLKRLAAARGTLDMDPEVPTFATYVEGDFARLVIVRFKASTREPRYALVCLRTVLRSAVELGVLQAMPRLPRLPAKSEKLPAAPPLAVVVQTSAATEGWLRVAIALAALAGLRCGEVRAIEVRDVGLEGGRLFVRRAYSADELGVPKGRDERAVPLTPLLASILTHACEGKAPTALLVADDQGEALRESMVGWAWRRLQARLGIEPPWRFHSLRHFFGTTCLRGGANVEAVRRLLGHRDLASTTRYVHATERDLVTAVAALPGIGSGNGGETEDRPRP